MDRHPVHDVEGCRIALRPAGEDDGFHAVLQQGRGQAQALLLSAGEHLWHEEVDQHDNA
jgi:hypothetical protein